MHNGANASLSLRRIALTLSAVALLLTLVSAVSYSLDHAGVGVPTNLRLLLDVDGESNLPAWYSSCLLLICSLLLAGIFAIKHITHGRFQLQWLLLALIFAGMSLDEEAEIHELGNVLSTDSVLFGTLHYGWVVLAIPLAGAVAIAYLSFLKHLPRDIRLLFVGAGSIYVAAVIGMEFAESLFTVDFGETSVATAIVTHIEESMEMLGIILFGSSLGRYLSTYTFSTSLALRQGSQDALEFRIDAQQAGFEGQYTSGLEGRSMQLQVVHVEATGREEAGVS